VRFRVGHESQDAPRGIGDAGRGAERTVGIVGKLPGRLSAHRVHVAESHQLLLLHARQEPFVPRVELALAVAHRDFQEFSITPGGYRSPGEFLVEGDASSAMRPELSKRDANQG